VSVISRWRFRKLGAFPPPLWGRAREGVRAIALLFFLGAIANAQTFTPRDESPEEFPAGAGRDETFYACTACHNFKLVAAQGLTRAGWEDSLNLMVRSTRRTARWCSAIWRRPFRPEHPPADAAGKIRSRSNDSELPLVPAKAGT